MKSFPISEEVVYAYLLHEEQVVDAAPTYHRSFLSSIAFCIHVLGLASAACVLESKRICGLAAKRYLLKRKTRSRLPLLTREALLLERIGLGQCGRPLADRHAAECFLFMVFARARYSDMQNVTTLQVETEVVEDMHRPWFCGVRRWQIQDLLQLGTQGQTVADECDGQWFVSCKIVGHGLARCGDAFTQIHMFILALEVGHVSRYEETIGVPRG